MEHRQSTIYVIDDDESIRRSLERLLRSANLELGTFSSVEEFFSGERQGDNACVIVDMRMAGSTGFDLQRELASRGMGIPVIVISASDDTQTREQAWRLVAVAFFRKPIDDQALLEAIQVGKRRTAHPVILKIDVREAIKEGIRIEKATDRIYVADHIPKKFISVDKGKL